MLSRAHTLQTHFSLTKTKEFLQGLLWWLGGKDPTSPRMTGYYEMRLEVDDKKKDRRTTRPLRWASSVKGTYNMTKFISLLGGLNEWVNIKCSAWHMVLFSLLSPVWLCDPLDYNPPGSSVHGISQARMLEWVDISYSRGSSWPRDWTCVSWVS